MHLSAQVRQLANIKQIGLARAKGDQFLPWDNIDLSLGKPHSLLVQKYLLKMNGKIPSLP